METQALRGLKSDPSNFQSFEERLQEPFEIVKIDLLRLVAPMGRSRFAGEEKGRRRNFNDFSLLKKVDPADFKGADRLVLLVDIPFGRLQKAREQRGAEDRIFLGLGVDRPQKRGLRSGKFKSEVGQFRADQIGGEKLLQPKTDAPVAECSFEQIDGIGGDL